MRISITEFEDKVVHDSEDGEVNASRAVTHTMVYNAVVDREQDGRENLEENGIRLHALFRLSKMVRVFKDKGKVAEETVGAVLRFLEENQRVAVSKVEKEKRLLSP
ncbi:hypothetical protein ACLB2K_035306 [Fragaria x ananassa]